MQLTQTHIIALFGNDRRANKLSKIRKPMAFMMLAILALILCLQ